MASADVLGYLPNQQRFQSLNCRNRFYQPELFEPAIRSSRWLPAFRLSSGQELCLRLFAAGEPEHGAGSGRRFRLQPGLQLQRRTPSESSHQRQHDPRRFDGEQLQGALRLPGVAPQPIHRQRVRVRSGPGVPYVSMRR